MSHRKRVLRHGPRTSVLAASVGALIASGGMSGTALGQEADDEEAEDSQDQDTIIVTGTRIRRDDYTATNATTVISADEMRSLGVTSVADMIAQLPSNVADTTATTNTDAISNFGLEVANLRGLNTSNGTRTLVLVDGNRFVPTTSSGVVDLNMIPTALVGQIETVTGGASATYGADAMAGVVNVILDNNIEGIRADLSYGTDDYGDADEINLSLGTGFEVLDRRGRITLGYDHNTTDGIPDCTARDWCARGFGMLQNGTQPQFSGNEPGIPVDNPFFADEPQYIITEGVRYTRVPEGMMLAGLDFDAGESLLTAEEITALQMSGNWDGAFAQVEPVDGGAFGNDSFQNSSIGTYRFTPDGTGVLPYLDVGPNGQPLSQAQYNYVTGRGTGGVTPWGSGALEFANTPLRSENSRDNLFTQFQYDFENGVALTTNLSFSRSETTSSQNSQRQSNWNVGCIFPDNAFLDSRSGATDSLRELIGQRRAFPDTFAAVPVPGVTGDGVRDEYNPFAADPYGGTGACRPGPYLGQSLLDDGETVELYDFPEQVGTTGINKSVAPFTNRYQVSENETTNLRLGARGPLFEDGSWTWDVNLTYGQSERQQTVFGQQSDRRMEMATHSVWDEALNQPVCAINSTNPYNGIWREDNPDLVGFDVPDGQVIVPVGATVGEYFTQKWLSFIEASLGDEGSPQLAQTFFDSMADGCAPVNPFGLAIDPAAVAYAWPSLIQGSENDQLATEVNFSGDIWRGVGAGPFRMAGGLSWRENETINFADPNPYTARDFDIRYSDSYSGITEAEDAYVEFDLPVLRDKPGADFLSFNLGYRKTENITRREEGEASIVTSKTTRDIDSWKASMVWRPLSMLMVRATRSADTRAPSAEELFAATQPVLTTGANLENPTPFRFDIPGTDVDERRDFWDELGDALGNAGNSRLEEEVSTTQTLGLVFTPTELLSGLSASIDYYETHIKGGVDNIGTNEVMENCALELIAEDFEFPGDYEFCSNVNFVLDNPDETQNLPLPDLTDETVTADPDGPFGSQPAPFNEVWIQAAQAGIPGFAEGDINPFYPFSNIDSVAPSAVNSAPYTSRGIDISVSYNTQLSGGGNISARVLVSRALEQKVETGGLFATSQGIALFGANPSESNAIRNVAGQTGSNGVGTAGSVAWLAPLFENYSPTPRISSNMFMTYRKNAFSVTSQIRYIGSGKLSNQRLWYGPDDVVSFIDSTGTLVQRAWGPGLTQTVESNDLPSWATLNMNFEYDFSRSRMQMDRFESLRVYLNITNIGDRVPDFFSGTGAGGINTTFFNTEGRKYQMGVRMQF